MWSASVSRRDCVRRTPGRFPHCGARDACGGKRFFAQRVERGFFRAHDGVGSFEHAQFLGLRRGKRGLNRPAPPQYMDLANPAFPQPFERMIRNIGGGQFFGRAAQDARYVDGDIADADNHRGADGQVEFQMSVVRMPVVPRHEFGSRTGCLSGLSPGMPRERSVCAPVA